MKLYSRPFLRSIRQAAIPKIRQTKSLRREFKLRRRRDRVKVYVWSAVCSLLAFYWIINNSGAKPDLPLLMIAYYATGTVVFRAAGFFARLHGHEALLFAALPISDSDFFRLQWGKFLLRSCWLLAVFPALYLVFAIEHRNNVGFSILVSVFAGVVQWIAVNSVAVLLIGVRNRVLIWLTLALYASVLVLLFLPPDFAATWSQRLKELTSFFPAGWINRGYCRLLAGDLMGLAWISPALLAIVPAIFRLRTLRSSFHLMWEWPGSVEADVEDEPAAEGQSALVAKQDTLPETVTVAQAVARINHGEWLRVPDWSTHGWVERAAGAWLSSEDRELADFLLGDVGRWSARWTKALYVTAVTVLIVRFLPLVPVWAGIFGAFVAACLAAPLMGGAWSGFATVWLQNQQSYMIAFYPVSYWRCSRVIFKVNFVRLLAWFVLLLPACIALGWRFEISAAQALTVSLKIVYLLLLGQFIAIVGKHSSRTNDTQDWSLRNWLFFAFVIVCIFVTMGGLFAFLVPDNLVVELVGGLIVALACVLAWWIYGLFYNRGRFDLLSQPR